MMKKLNNKTFLLFYLPLILLMACGESAQEEIDTLPYYFEASFTPQWLSPKDKSLKKFHRISPFRLTNQEGETVTEKTFEGKIYVADFFFTTCPGICPKMTANMLTLHKEFLEDEQVLLLSHTVTPETDSVPVLKAYAKNRGVSSEKWHFVTGSQKEIYKLGREDYFVEEDLGLTKDSDEFLHTENFVLIDKKRHIRGIYNGLNKASLRQLIADIKTLKEKG